MRIPRAMWNCAGISGSVEVSGQEEETYESDGRFSGRCEGREDSSHRLDGIGNVVGQSVLRSMGGSSDSDCTNLVSPNFHRARRCED